MNELEILAEFSDQALILALRNAVREERFSLAKVLEHLIEFDNRRLYAPEGFSSLFEYCMRELNYAPEAAYKRIRAARAAAKFPIILRMLRSDDIQLSAVVVLHAHLNQENHQELLNKARGMSKRELEFLAAGLCPKPDIADSIRSLPAPADASLPASVPVDPVTETPPLPKPSVAVGPSWFSPPKSIRPLSENRARFAFTAGREVLRMIDRARELLRGRYPAGDLESIFTDALKALLRQIDPDRRLEGKRSRKGRPSGDPRRIPQSVRDAVWRRDGGRCAYVKDGSRCAARSALEFDHIAPFAQGGRSDDPGNIRLLCRAHNGLEARRAFGEDFVDEAIRRRKKIEGKAREDGPARAGPIRRG